MFLSCSRIDSMQQPIMFAGNNWRGLEVLSELQIIFSLIKTEKYDFV